MGLGLPEESDDVLGIGMLVDDLTNPRLWTLPSFKPSNRPEVDMGKGN